MTTRRAAVAGSPVFGVPVGSMSSTCASSHGHRTMLDALRDDEQLAGPELHILVTQLDPEAALQHEEEVIGVLVAVPDELPLHLHHHQVVPVELADGARLEVLGEGAELLREIDAVHGPLS